MVFRGTDLGTKPGTGLGLEPGTGLALKLKTSLGVLRKMNTVSMFMLYNIMIEVDV